MSIVKPLEWIWVERTSMWAAKSVVGEYFAWFIEPNGVFLAPGKSHGTLRGASIEETKAAAQADHDARILSALAAPPPAQAAGVTEEARFLLERLEEFEREMDEDRGAFREYVGHVAPSAARLKALLSAQDREESHSYGDLDAGAANHHDHSKRGFDPK